MEEYAASTIQQIPSYNSADSLRIRLDTETVLKEIEAHLKGMVLTEHYNAETGRYEVQGKRVSEPLANEEGQHRLLMWVRSRVNHACVQGNFSKQDFKIHIADMMSNLNFDLHLNIKRWGIEESNARYIIYAVMDLVEEFLSRTVDNQERKLFATSTESRHEKQKQSSWGLGGGKTWQ